MSRWLCLVIFCFGILGFDTGCGAQPEAKPTMAPGAGAGMKNPIKGQGGKKLQETGM